MPDPVESRQAIPLYQVLVEEFNHQFPGKKIPLAEIEAQRGRWEEEYAAVADPAERRQAVDDALVGELYQLLQASGVERSALCFSGGGIRSATFGLGIVQGLARRGLLGAFDFLSTVSGGGYLGSWLSGWIVRESGGVAGVAEVERRLASPPKTALAPEPEPVHHLREYSRYMSPKLGFLSADTWTLVAIFCRNLILNWLVLLPLLAAALVVPRISIVLVRWTPPAGVPPAVFWGGVLCGIVSIAYIIANRPSLTALPPPGSAATQPESRFPRRFQGQLAFLALCLLPLALMAIAATLCWAWVVRTAPGQADPNLDELHFDVLGLSLSARLAFVLFGVLLHVGGFLLSRLWVRSSGKRVLAELVVTILTGAVGGWLAWLAAEQLLPAVRPGLGAEIYVCSAAPLLLFLFLVAAILFVGLASKYTEDADREWLARCGAWVLIVILLRGAMGALVIFGPVLWTYLGIKTMSAVGGVSGLVTLLLGHSSKTGAAEAKRGEPAPTSTQVANIVMAVVAPLFALSVLVGLSALTTLLIKLLGRNLLGLSWPIESYLKYDYHSFLAILATTPGWLLLGVAAGFLLLGTLMGRFVDINRFSLHAAYRDRLIRAYLGASRPGGERRPNPFTGFDDADNLPMTAILGNRPFHVVNVALNLVAGKDLAWQDRKAESFTFSALHSGYREGYRRSEVYGLHADRKTAVSLGTAVAISGAAASPNMGYHSSPVVTFLLALFNVRLGWWLGNTAAAGAHTFDTPGPRFAPKALLAETFGLTDDEHPYVYLSDGGHFENLALYEMVLRRCRYIVVSDGGADGDFTFEDLGNAISKIRIDLGIPIEFERLPMRARPDLRGKSYDRVTGSPEFPYCAVARIHYSCVDPVETPGEEIDGWLLYVKASLNGTETADVFHYAKLHPTFPHESTGNQLYSEAQFESYRELGSHMIDRIAEGLPAGADLAAFFAQAATYAKGKG
ncbi:MAG TPA: hypothetical protein VFE33_35675 [Thermoanaerobaculia bacterium]|nr:hypothetical protein [Thermoanaerobaculia bacterium]